MKGKLYLIPSPLGDNDPAEVIPATTLALLQDIGCYVVEEVRTARRYLSRAGLKGRIQDLEFHELNEHTSQEEVEKLAALFNDGRNVGLISEAGLPAVADPGAALVALCHRCGIEVVPQVGPSSLMMSLMASGLNGQQFAFNGYLPVDRHQRAAAIRKLESLVAHSGATQIFIEAPYRNNQMLQSLAETCHPETLICVACDLTQATQTILTRSAAQWRKQQSHYDFHKRPTVFLIGR